MMKKEEFPVLLCPDFASVYDVEVSWVEWGVTVLIEVICMTLHCVDNCISMDLFAYISSVVGLCDFKFLGH
ncbi:UNVERIFIED_CONTAM: hypothetical protein FKN15_007709 [Acipenser sinensis]